jgi:hypothetical protein
MISGLLAACHTRQSGGYGAIAVHQAASISVSISGL